MERWSERRWWHYVLPIVILEMGVVAIWFTLLRDSPYEVIIAGAMSFVVVAGWLAHLQDYTMRAADERALAVVSRESGHIVAASLEKARLVPWPWRQYFLVKTYPTSFRCLLELYLLTASNIRIPVRVAVRMWLGPHTAQSQWLPDFLRDDVFVTQQCRSCLFNAIRSLPPEITDQLDPYNVATITALKEYLECALKDTLPYPLRIAVSVSAING